MSINTILSLVDLVLSIVVATDALLPDGVLQEVKKTSETTAKNIKLLNNLIEKMYLIDFEYYTN